MMKNGKKYPLLKRGVHFFPKSLFFEDFFIFPKNWNAVTETSFCRINNRNPFPERGDIDFCDRAHYKVFAHIRHIICTHRHTPGTENIKNTIFSMYVWCAWCVQILLVLLQLLQLLRVDKILKNDPHRVLVAQNIAPVTKGEVWWILKKLDFWWKLIKNRIYFKTHQTSP